MINKINYTKLLDMFNNSGLKNLNISYDTLNFESTHIINDLTKVLKEYYSFIYYNQIFIN